MVSIAGWGVEFVEHHLLDYVGEFARFRGVAHAADEVDVDERHCMRRQMCLGVDRVQDIGELVR